MSFAMDRLIKAINLKKNPTALGLDTQIGHLPEGFAREDETAAQAIVRYNVRLLDLLSDIVPCVKVQAAYYEMLGVAGMQAFADTLRAARERGYVTIADAKRNDIGATAEAYANAYLEPGADFEADFLTVNAYLGIDGIEPFLEKARTHGKGIFMLVKTSNPSGGQVQDLHCQERSIYEIMGDYAEQWGESLRGEYGYSAVGAVVGATYPEQGSALRRRLAHTFFLVPGYGAQGASGKDLRGCFDKDGNGAVVNASRSLLTAHKKAPDMDWKDAVRAEALRMREDIG